MFKLLCKTIVLSGLTSTIKIMHYLCNRVNLDSTQNSCLTVFTSKPYTIYRVKIERTHNNVAIVGLRPVPFKVSKDIKYKRAGI